MYYTTAEGDRIMVPQQLIATVLEHYHCHALTHVGRNKMYKYLTKKFFWPWFFKDIERWVKACLRCQKFKSPKPRNHELLQLQIESSFPFDIVGLAWIFYICSKEQRQGIGMCWWSFIILPIGRRLVFWKPWKLKRLPNVSIT